jgi:hypothetical protein
MVEHPRFEIPKNANAVSHRTLRAANGETLLFVIFNQRGNVVRFRDNQDYFVMLIQNTRGGPRAFNYKPSMLTMRLSNTESQVGSEEYEPKTKSQ